MKILLSPDSFKGSLPAKDAAAALARGLASELPMATIVQHPLSDGGEGTLDVLTGVGFVNHHANVVDSFGTPITARFVSRGNHVVIESAEAFRFHPDATPEQALTASSFGVGLLILKALELNPDTITVSVGGTAGTDGGAGMLHALGAGLFDAKGTQVGGGGGQLTAVERVDLSGLDPRLLAIDVQVVTDVHNPLLGEQGSARVFAAQKGADPAGIEALEAGLRHFASLLDPDLATQAATGAGGGLSYGAMAALKASVRSGAQWMMELTDWEGALEGADLVITGEGSFDEQSMAGKITGVVMKRATDRGVPVVVVCGVNRAEVPLLGVTVVQLVDWAPDQESSIAHAETLLERAGRHIGALGRG